MLVTRGGLLAYISIVVHITYTTGTRAFPEYTACMRRQGCGPRACVYISGKALMPVV